jgi:hypothetical protein
MRGRQKWVAAFGSGLLLAGLTSSTGHGTAVAASPDGGPEVASARLEAMAEAGGALGMYFDSVADRFVVVVPAAGASTFRPSDAAGLGLAVSVESRPITRETVDKATAALEALRPAVSDSYGFSFDPESGKILLQAGSDESEFASVERQFPGAISYHRGEWHLTSWDNDGQPHWGGAWLQGGGWACTSGFSIADFSGHSYMVTAGHCFTSGTGTNMGTVLRESAAYPYYDFEVVYGHSYQGKLYDSYTHGRPVKNGANPSIGTHYCTTGRTSGFYCNWTLQRLNQTICYSNMSTCFHDLAGFNNPSLDHVLGGDSGGPLYYQYADGTAGVRGVISGYFWDIYTLAYMSYAQPYGDIANYYVMHAMTYP